jgi:hypothetical protein
MTEFSFFPNAEQARLGDRKMRQGLAESLAYVIEEVDGAITFDRPSIEANIARMREGVRFAPGAFGHYYLAVQSIADENFEHVTYHLDAIGRQRPLADEMEIVALSEAMLGKDVQIYTTLLGAEDASSFRFLPPPAPVADDFASRFRDGMALLDRAAPNLAEEVRVLVSQMVMAVGDKSFAYEFDGASVYSLWGALFLNAESHVTPLAMAEAIAHEAGHSLLFGMSVDEPLVRNPDDALYPSPLRVDPRPMDGIYHATFVSSRMHWAMQTLIDSGQLDDEQRVAAAEARDGDTRNFWAGYKTVAEFGDLTPTGRSIMTAAHAYMASVAA